MAAEVGIPDKLLPAIRLAVFWISLPFILLLIGLERYFSGNIYEVISCLVGALLSIIIAVKWDSLVGLVFLLHKDTSGLQYLSHEDEELGSAVRNMGWFSAWAKWYASQYLVNNDRRPASEEAIMATASHLVLDALVDGQIEARGRKPGQLEYEIIPQTHWRSSALHMVKDNKTLWRMIIFPRGGAEISPEGVVVAAQDAAAKERTDQLTAYDSLIVNGRQFESLWPRYDKKTDAARKRNLLQAKKLGSDPAEIQKLSS